MTRAVAAHCWRYSNANCVDNRNGAVLGGVARCPEPSARFFRPGRSFAYHGDAAVRLQLGEGDKVATEGLHPI